MMPKNKRTGATYPMLPNTPRSMLLNISPSMPQIWKLLKNKNTQTAKVPRITASDCKKLLSASCFFVPVRFAAVVFVPAVFFPAVFPDAVVFFFVLLPAKMKAPYLKIRAKTLIK